MSNLKEGTKLKEVTWDSGNTYGRVGETVKSITVSMEAGQMGMVPWALVIFHDGERCLVNLACCENVELAKEA